MESMESLSFMVSMGHHRDALDYSEYHWMSGTPLQFHGIPYYCMETDRIPKNPIGFHGISIPWDSMEFQGMYSLSGWNVRQVIAWGCLETLRVCFHSWDECLAGIWMGSGQLDTENV